MPGNFYMHYGNEISIFSECITNNDISWNKYFSFIYLKQSSQQLLILPKLIKLMKNIVEIGIYVFL